MSSFLDESVNLFEKPTDLLDAYVRKDCAIQISLRNYLIRQIMFLVSLAGPVTTLVSQMDHVSIKVHTSDMDSSFHALKLITKWLPSPLVASLVAVMVISMTAGHSFEHMLKRGVYLEFSKGRLRAARFTWVFIVLFLTYLATSITFICKFSNDRVTLRASLLAVLLNIINVFMVFWNAVNVESNTPAIAEVFDRNRERRDVLLNHFGALTFAVAPCPVSFDVMTQFRRPCISIAKVLLASAVACGAMIGVIVYYTEDDLDPIWVRVNACYSSCIWRPWNSSSYHIPPFTSPATFQCANCLCYCFEALQYLHVLTYSGCEQRLSPWASTIQVQCNAVDVCTTILQNKCIGT